MKRPRGKLGFCISVGVLITAIVASAYLYKREADKAKKMEDELEAATGL